MEEQRTVVYLFNYHPFGTGGFELYVIAQHGRELLRIHLAVVGPGWVVAAGTAVVCSVFGLLRFSFAAAAAVMVYEAVG